jgi:hypothetical protein
MFSRRGSQDVNGRAGIPLLQSHKIGCVARATTEARSSSRQVDAVLKNEAVAVIRQRSGLTSVISLIQHHIQRSRDQSPLASQWKCRDPVKLELGGATGMLRVDSAIGGHFDALLMRWRACWSEGWWREDERGWVR